jgi:hypothetical protein
MTSPRSLVRLLLKHVHPDVVPPAQRRHNELSLQRLLGMVEDSSRPLGPPVRLSFHLRDGGTTSATMHPGQVSVGLDALLYRAKLSPNRPASSSAPARRPGVRAGKSRPLLPPPHVVRAYMMQQRAEAPRAEDAAASLLRLNRIRVERALDLDAASVRAAVGFVRHAASLAPALFRDVLEATSIDILIEFEAGDFRLAGRNLHVPLDADPAEFIAMLRKVVAGERKKRAG